MCSLVAVIHFCEWFILAVNCILSGHALNCYIRDRMFVCAKYLVFCFYRTWEIFGLTTVFPFNAVTFLMIHYWKNKTWILPNMFSFLYSLCLICKYCSDSFLWSSNICCTVFKLCAPSILFCVVPCCAISSTAFMFWSFSPNTSKLFILSSLWWNC